MADANEFAQGFVEKCASLGITDEVKIQELLMMGFEKYSKADAAVMGKDAVKNHEEYYRKAGKLLGQLGGRGASSHSEQK